MDQPGGIMLARMLPTTLLFMLPCLFIAGCQRAQPYPQKSEPESSLAVPPEFLWSKTKPVRDITIRFVSADTDPEAWQKLPGFWNPVPFPLTGTPLAPVGQSPLGAAVVVGLIETTQAIHIKVPLGLPDPTPHIPDSNPPTFGKWHLGKQLFFDGGWLTGIDSVSCASCHAPKTGFAEPLRFDAPPRMQAPSLINSVYNTHQFWDGRVRYLEETLPQQQVDFSGRYLPHHLHQFNWNEIIPRLKKEPKYSDAFAHAFGSPEPTAHAVSQCLATYLRTILSGNSLHDRAKQAAQKEGSAELLAMHFEPLLNESTLSALKRPAGVSKRGAANDLERGYTLFHSSATHCADCHKGWNFTDNSFHNIGQRESDYLQIPGKEFGRFAVLPAGLQENRLIGAFKTPSLRNLPKTAPYFHNGSLASLEGVVRYYNDGLPEYNPQLDPVLRSGPRQPRALHLTEAEIDAIAVFLRSLDGEAVPEIVAKP
jgi:cytochrome c peroxidase